MGRPADGLQIDELCLVCALLVVAALGCSGGSNHAGRQRAESTTVSSTGSVSHAPTVRLHIALSSRKLVAGQWVSAAVDITNGTGAPLHLQTAQGCKPNFALVVGSDAIPQHADFSLACEPGALVVPEGRTTYPLALTASFVTCRPAGANGAVRACLPGNNMPPLEAGRYRVSFEDNGTALPVPEPVPVQVVAAP